MRTSVALLLALLAAGLLRAQIPVTDLANLTNNRIAHTENIAKWAESILRLRTQIDQLNQQIRIQTDVRDWAGDPAAAGGRVSLDVLDAGDLVRDYGRTRRVILATVDSLSSLRNTEEGTFRAVDDRDIDGGAVRFDPQMFRRYAVLDEQQQNYQQVSEETDAREGELQEDLARTLEELKHASTDAEVQKQTAKIEAMNGQLAGLAAQRRDQADQINAQKIANDSRREQERLAAAELQAKDDFLANQRITTFMRTIRVRQNMP